MSPHTDKIAAVAALAALLGWPGDEVEALRGHLESLARPPEGDFDRLYAAQRFGWERERPLMLYHDWKESVADLQWSVVKVGGPSWGLEETPPAGPFTPPEGVALYEDGVFEHVDAWLRERGLELLYVDSPGDHYALLLGRVEDRDALVEVMGRVGFSLTPVV